MDKHEELQQLQRQHTELREKRAAQKVAMQKREDHVEFPLTEAGQNELTDSTEKLNELERRIWDLHAEIEADR